LKAALGFPEPPINCSKTLQFTAASIEKHSRMGTK
jgi:hypothetical protein